MREPGQSYTERERARAIAWKRASATLPEDARAPAPYGSGTRPYDFCLPAEYASLNLLPEVRGHALALALFAELGIPWHQSVAGGPGNHLLSSQVQCVNALGQMVHDPARLDRAFGGVLDIAELCEVEPGRFLTFEYIGPVDYFAEAPRGARVRGAKCTSVDAAFMFRAGDGARELALVEWKYTESYRLRRPAPRADEVRRGRYEPYVLADDGPVRGDLVPFVDLLDEPFYQLMRQQLLAWQLECDPAVEAERVRVVHVLPAGNAAYRASVHRESFRALGATVGEVWQRLLRMPDRFVSMDSAVFADPDVTSEEYVARYGA